MKTPFPEHLHESLLADQIRAYERQGLLDTVLDEDHFQKEYLGVFHDTEPVPDCPKCPDGRLRMDRFARGWICPACGYTSFKPGPVRVSFDPATRLEVARRLDVASRVRAGEHCPPQPTPTTMFDMFAENQEGARP